MSEEKNEIVVGNEEVTVNGKGFVVAREQIPFDELMSRAEQLSKSNIIPQQYQRKPENVFIALDMANRIGISPMVVMQQLNVIMGNLSWSGQACAMLLRNSKEWTDVTMNYVGKPNTKDWGAYVTATKRKTGKEVKGATVTLQIAKNEGWYDKPGSKWKTMPELMLAYRAYAWFIRVHSPELLMGLQTSDEVVDVNVKSSATNPFKDKED